jgi:hypothetical protein
MRTLQKFLIFVFILVPLVAAAAAGEETFLYL